MPGVVAGDARPVACDAASRRLLTEPPQSRRRPILRCGPRSPGMSGGATTAASERTGDRAPGGPAGSRPSPAKLLARMLAGNQVQQALFVTTKLGLPDLIA